MTNRERFYQTMHYGSPDRIPYFEEGIRHDVIHTWRQQGLKSKKELSRLFPTDARDEIYLDLDPYPPVAKLGIELSNVHKRFDPNSRRRWPWNWHKSVKKRNKSDTIRFLRVHRGFFLALGVDGWKKFEKIITLVGEKPDYVKSYLEIYGRFCAVMAERVLNDISVDAAIFSEPIGGKEGPLISPDLYESMILPTYKPVFEILHKHNISIIILRTYANIGILLPPLLKAGFNCLWACEPDIPEMDYRLLRRLYGKKLRLIGGLNINCLRSNKEKIRDELKRKIPELLNQGGYIPLVDGRVRADIPFENYVYYRQLLYEYTMRRSKHNV
jgi:hypothetical protein